MVDNFATKPLGLVLIATAHMVLNVFSHVDVIGILGDNVTLEFTFSPNITVKSKSHYAIYRNISGHKRLKIEEYIKGKQGDIFDVYPKNNSVSWRIINLKVNDTGSYCVSLFQSSGPPKESNKVQLSVQQVNRSSTVPLMEGNSTIVVGSGNNFHAITVFVVSPIVLLAALLPFLIWSLVGLRDKPHKSQSCNPTVQETVEVSVEASQPSVVYSVLDFPKRASAVLDSNVNDTEYAAVSYHT